jgi:cytochrome c oxidase assembly protein subunit 11
MPVTFYIDPELAKDRNLDEVTDIALSYTFFRAPGKGGDDSFVRATGGAAGATN